MRSRLGEWLRARAPKQLQFQALAGQVREDSQASLLTSLHPATNLFTQPLSGRPKATWGKDYACQSTPCKPWGAPDPQGDGKEHWGVCKLQLGFSRAKAGSSRVLTLGFSPSFS